VTFPIATWLDRFFDAHYAAHPVCATFIGRHHVDHRLPDLSEHGLGDRLATIDSLLAEAEWLDLAGASVTEEVDLELAKGALRLERWELESGHQVRANPAYYTGEAVFGIIGLFLTEFAPLKERIDAAVARLVAIPVFLQQARGNLFGMPGPWIDRALRECRGASALLTVGVERLVAEQGPDAEVLGLVAGRAARAFDEFGAFLAEQRAEAPVSYAAGPDALARHLEDGHRLERSAVDIAEWAEHELTETDRQLRLHAAVHGVADPAGLLDALAQIHPTAVSYYDRYQEVWDACRSKAEEHELLTWPDFPIRYVPQPRWVRAAASDLYFLSYRSPAAFDRPSVHEYLVAPLEESDDLSRQRFLRANNDSVIKLNHVVHHGAIGHHVQNWHAFRAASRIGQVAGVDCASRIAFHCGGTKAEGWACYATALMAEVGFLTPLETLSELATRRRMCARAVVDVGIHHGGLTIDEAARYYVERAGMSPEGGLAEAVKNSMFPGTGLMYLVGTDAIQQLRHEVSGRLGPSFDLRAFHDELLGHGSIPVTVSARLTLDRIAGVG